MNEMQIELDFYNTNLTKEPELSERKSKALSQESVILNFYNNHKILTASDVQRYCDAMGKQWPLTSVRRAITNLSKKGYLKRTDSTKKGLFGANERYYEIYEQ